MEKARWLEMKLLILGSGVTRTVIIEWVIEYVLPALIPLLQASMAAAERLSAGQTCSVPPGVMWRQFLSKVCVLRQKIR